LRRRAAAAQAAQQQDRLLQTAIDALTPAPTHPPSVPPLPAPGVAQGGVPAAVAGVAFPVRVAARRGEVQAAADRQLAASAALWHRYGEQGTRWFHRLGRTVPRRVPLLAVQPPSGQRVALDSHGQGKHAMDAAIVQHFVGPSGVFAPAAIDAAAGAQLLQAIDRKVPDSMQQAADGPFGDGRVTPDCLQQALKATPPGKSPGSDGLQYEVYTTLAGILLPPLADACNEALQAGAAGELPETMRTGIITLLHKGGNKAEDSLDSFRPITLLNSDYKLLAKVLVTRLSPMVEAVVDQTQTAFLPGRWIGDNILHHLEEVDYCQVTSTPGCILFLDFQQAYDRVSRDWLGACMGAMGLPPAAVLWVQLLLRGTQARVRYHGWHTPLMQLTTGLAQGSPLSPLLWVIVAQPLAARMRQLQRQGLVGAIQLPNGVLAPPVHQHADDTTIHTDSRASAATALQQGVNLFAAATNSKLNISKSHGLEVGTNPPFTGVDVATGITFLALTDPPIRHLGVLLGHDSAAASRQMFEGRLKGMHAGVRHWARFDLGYLGRLHVAKTVLASAVYFHATFDMPPPDIMARMQRCISQFVTTGVAADDGAGPARGRPPGAAIEALPRMEGGLGRVDLEAQVTALQAKVAALALHPRRHPWKRLFQAAMERAHPLLGLAALVSQRRPTAGGFATQLSPRQLTYWRALHRLKVFRCVTANRLTGGHVRAERLLHNACIAPPGQAKYSALPPGMQAGCTTVGDLQGCWEGGGNSIARGVYMALPEAWREHASVGPQRRPLWEVSSCGTRVRCLAHFAVGQAYQVLSDGRLAPLDSTAPALPVTSHWEAAAVVLVPCQQATTPTIALPSAGGHLSGVLQAPGLQPYLLDAWSKRPLDPNIWAIARGTPLSHFTVAAARIRLLRMAARQHRPDFKPGATARPRLWGASGDPAAAFTQAEGQVQQRFQGMQQGAGPGGTRRQREATTEEAYDALWMHPSQPREGPLQRAQQRGAASQQVAAAARRDDRIDVAALAAEPDLCKGLFRQLWCCGLDRSQVMFMWRLLHGGLPYGAARLGMVPPQGAEGRHEALMDSCCQAPECAPSPGGGASTSTAPPPTVFPPLETATHLFWECPVVAPAVGWLWDVWEGIVGVPVPRAPATLLLGAWQPQGKGRKRLWLQLRAAFLWSVWRLRCERRCTGGGYSAAAVVALTRSTLERAVKLDFAVATQDLPQAAGLARAWFRGRQLGAMDSLPEFMRSWCAGEVIAHIDFMQPALTLRVHIPSFTQQNGGSSGA
jgi:hypothetical protein